MGDVELRMSTTVSFPCDNNDWWNHTMNEGDNHPWQCDGETVLTIKGWVCEEHPLTVWPHDDCAGPGMPVSNIERLLKELEAVSDE